MAARPLHEFGPASSGAEAVALGFALGLAASWAGAAGVFWAGEDGLYAEEGAPYPQGLAQFGLDPAWLIVVRASKREDVLWAAEQGLAAPGAVVICALRAHGKPLDLKATRRLLLFAERNHARCLLVRPLVDPLELGPFATNCYLVRAAGGASEAGVVDPSGAATHNGSAAIKFWGGHSTKNLY